MSKLTEEKQKVTSRFNNMKQRILDLDTKYKFKHNPDTTLTKDEMREGVEEQGIWSMIYNAHIVPAARSMPECRCGHCQSEHSFECLKNAVEDAEGWRDTLLKDVGREGPQTGTAREKERILEQ